jgi:hypothetical protein
MNTLQNVVDAFSDSLKAQRKNYHLTLGGLLEILSSANPQARVIFEDETTPSQPHSYRGYYSDLAFEPITIDTLHDAVTAKDLHDLLTTTALGKSFTGYKGGEFVMDKDTPLWRSEYGDASDLAIIDARRQLDNDKPYVVLITKLLEG